tara:strand:- start:105643 stop:106773 length:1131 start_codon:yes stop_codon:yes gene_type:complete
VDLVYLDYNATAPVKPEVTQVVMSVLNNHGNPSSVHSFGRDARELIEEARESVALMVGSQSSNVIFTSGGTESNNLAIKLVKKKRLIVSAAEHPSILAAADFAGAEKIILPVDSNGMVSPVMLKDILGPDGTDTLVSIMLANNETGVIQPIAELAQIARSVGAIIHCDAVQGPGRTAINMDALGIHMLSISAHKFGGLKGVGALVISSEQEVNPIIVGGGQERGWRGGTENVPGIIGMGKAAQLALLDLDNIEQIANLRDLLEKKILRIEPDVTIFGDKVDRLPNTSSFTMPGVQSETQVMALDLAGIAVSAGSACSSGKVEPSHVLTAMGYSEAIGGCAIRVSIGWTNTEEDIDRFINTWKATYSGLASRHRNSI